MVCVIIRGGVPPFSVREESLLNSKHISPERYFVSVFTFVHIGVPPFSVREDSLSIQNIFRSNVTLQSFVQTQAIR